MKKTILRYAFIVALLLRSGATLHAKGPGTSGAEFLNLGVGAAATSLAGAYGALATGADALFWNVAGLAQPQGRAHFSLNHASMFGGLRHDAAGVAFPMLKDLRAGVSFNRLSQPSLSGYDNQGGKTNDFTASDQALGLGLGMPLGSLWSGVLIQAVESKIAGYSARTILADIGLKKPGSRLDMGLALRHLGPGLRFGQEREASPATLQASGLLRVYGPVALAVQSDYGLAEKGLRFGVGTEYALAAIGRTRMSLRMGVRPEESFRDPLSLLRGGFGLDGALYRLDYAFLPGRELGATHRFSVGLKL